MSKWTIRRLHNRPAVVRGTNLTRPSSLNAVSGLLEIERLAAPNGGMAGKTYTVSGDSLEVFNRLIKWSYTYNTPNGSNIAGCEDA